MRTFYLGTHMVNWLAHSPHPLFLSDVRLRDRKSLPTAVTRWALDSGAFSQLATYGYWPEGSTRAYARRVQRYRDEIGNLEWAAPQDWMCEPFMLARTGLTVRQHQERTVANYLKLRDYDNSLPIIPVLQGYTLAEYMECVTLYERAGVSLTNMPLVGLGSVCRRQASTGITALVVALRQGIPHLHGFGVKRNGLAMYRHMLDSADSMAWSYDARRKPALPGHTHKNCANCWAFASQWYERTTV